MTFIPATSESSAGPRGQRADASGDATVIRMRNQDAKHEHGNPSFGNPHGTQSFAPKKQLVSSTLSLEFPSYRRGDSFSPTAVNRSPTAVNRSQSAVDLYPFRKRSAMTQAAWSTRLSSGGLAAGGNGKHQQARSRTSHFGQSRPAKPGRIANGSRLGTNNGRPVSAPPRPSTAPPGGAPVGVGHPQQVEWRPPGTTDAAEIFTALARLDSATSPNECMAISRELLQLVIDRDGVYGAVLQRIQQEFDAHDGHGLATAERGRGTPASKRHSQLKADYDNLSREFHDLRSRSDQVCPLQAVVACHCVCTGVCVRARACACV